MHFVLQILPSGANTHLLVKRLQPLASQPVHSGNASSAYAGLVGLAFWSQSWGTWPESCSLVLEACHQRQTWAVWFGWGFRCSSLWRGSTSQMRNSHQKVSRCPSSPLPHKFRSWGLGLKTWHLLQVSRCDRPAAVGSCYISTGTNKHRGPWQPDRWG